MNRPALMCLSALALVALPGVASAQVGDPAIAVGGTVGTTGLGLDVQFALGPLFVLRGTLDSLDYGFDETYDGVDYRADMKFDTVGAFVDLHPFANGLFVSGGVYTGDRDTALLATPSEPVTLGGQSFDPDEVGTLTGAVKLAGTAPFVGVGWDSTFTRTSRWGFRALAGVAVSDDPDVALTSTGGTLSNDPSFQARLDAEVEEIQAEAEDHGLFPVVQLGLNYKF